MAAAAFDYDHGTAEVAGFVISMSSLASDVAHEVISATKLIAAHYPGTTVESEGFRGKSPGGYPSMLMTTLTIQAPIQTGVSHVRNELFTALLNKHRSKLAGLPATYGAKDGHFTVRLTTVLRPGGRVIFMGAVSAQSFDRDLTHKTRLLAEDMGGGTGLAANGHPRMLACETRTLNKPPALMADFIWVMDETSSMYKQRMRIAGEAGAFFDLAMASGLDFRMGVTGVCAPKGKNKDSVGKFCSVASTDPKHLGGEDRFLKLSERATFSACLKNPPGRETALPFGLLNASRAVSGHLPRAENKPNKIRTGAKLVIIVITNSVPRGLNKIDLIPYLQTCTLPAKVQSSVDSELAPTIKNLKADKVDALYGLAGTCTNTCNLHVAHGYKETAKALGGAIYSLCHQDLQGRIKKIVQRTAATMSPVTLTHVPISASLRVAKSGVQLERSTTSGFSYAPAKNRLTFFGNQAWPKGSVLTVSYAQWK